MLLHVLGSGSKGNAFALSAEGGTLLVEAGFSAKELARRAEGAGVDLATVVGIAVTHEHGDHARGAVRLAGKLGVPLLASGGTWRRLADRPEELGHRRLGLAAAAEIGPFTVFAAPIVHDAAEPLALAVASSDGVKVGFAFDLGRPTISLRYLLRDCHAMVVEANYDDLLLRASGYPVSVQARIAGSAGHLSNRAAAELLRELMHPALDAVVLAHLSQQCNAPERARAIVDEALLAVGFGGRLFVAEQDHPLAPIALRLSVSLPPDGPAPDPDRVGPAPTEVEAWEDRFGPG